MLDAARSRARRGELRLSVPFGYIWRREAELGLDPDLRLQDVIRSIFARFHEFGSARQVLQSMTRDKIHFPRPSDEGRMTSFDWTPVRYRNMIGILKNPSMPVSTSMERARSGLPSLMDGHGGVTGVASRLAPGR